MGKIFLLGFVSLISFAALSRPWIGINAYYLFSILGPQYIWWWSFQGLRVSLIIAIAAITGVSFHILKKKHYDFAYIFNKQGVWLFVLWLSLTISYFAGPYVGFYSSSGLSPSEIFSITNTIFIFYFISSLEMNETRKLRLLVIVFSVSTIYLIYWANYQYLSQNWYQFNWGRLMGPRSINGGAIYNDENAFAMLFVTGLPFVYYLGLDLKRKLLRWLLWATIPFGWHAIFLTGSRGGLLGLVVVLFVVLLLSKRKLLIFPLLLTFLLFYIWQAGDVMQHRSTQIVDIDGERSANDRLTAWKGGLRMFADNPVTGVGLGSFITALPDYIESRHMVAHNTLVQYASESGFGAGLAYLVLVFLFFKHSKYVRRWCVEGRYNRGDEVLKIELYNNATTASFCGLFVCSMFLSLNVYEIFFILLLLNNSLYQICLQINREYYDEILT